MATTKTTSKLSRNPKEKVIAGIAAGLGEYFKLDPVIIRVIFIILALYQGVGIILYLALWLIIPTKSSKSSSDTVASGAKEMKKTAKELISNLDSTTPSPRKRKLGILLVILGTLFLLDNLNLISWDELTKFWPVMIILFGVYLFFRHD